MADPRIQLRDPWLALILAFVLPGLGHLYQRRFLKSIIFFVSVLGLFCWGLGTAEGKSVYYRPIWGEYAGNSKEGIGFIAQAGVGLVAWPAIWQHSRYYSQRGLRRNAKLEPINEPFVGAIDIDRDDGVLTAIVEGTISLEPGRGDFDQPVLVGTFVGQTEDGTSLELSVGSQTSLGLEIDADSGRPLVTRVLSDDGGDIGILEGVIPRPFWNYLEVPLSKDLENDINSRLGTQFELAYVLAMIAGMLNLLVAYDAFEGPAYGYDLTPSDSRGDGSPGK